MSSRARPPSPTETQVLIVGAGPVGLSLAIELGMRGIRCVVVEQHDRVGQNPRAKLTNVRSREILRRWGIADALRRASSLPADYPATIVFATRMNGQTLARFENAFYCSPERNDLYSESGQWVPQFTLEEVLRAHAGALKAVTIRFDCRFEALRQDDDGVTADVLDLKSGTRSTARAKYLIGADGPRSRVRELLGIEMSGQGALAPNVNVIFRAPTLSGLHGHGPAVQYWMVNRELPAYLGPMDGEALWFFIAPRLPGEMDVTSADPKDLVQRSCGLKFGLEIVHADPWTAYHLIADRYGEGRVFLAGDACHLHPPSGGHGMNMGIGDALDLGWKLAATLQGWGGPRLLGTYELERKPVHRRVMDEALDNYALVGDQLTNEDIEQPGPAGERARSSAAELIRKGKLREFRSLGVVLGYRYSDSPAIIPDGTTPPQQSLEYRPSAHPGCLAPHFWMADGASLYDQLGWGYTLLADGRTAREGIAGLERAAAGQSVPLKVVTLPDPCYRGLYQAAYALVRPDQHVAWRGERLPEDPAALLDRVRGA